MRCPSQTDPGFCGLRLWTVGRLTLVQCLGWLHLWCLSDTEKVVSHEWGLHQPDKHTRYIRQIYCTLNDLNVFFLWFQLKSLYIKHFQISSAAICLNQILLDVFFSRHCVSRGGARHCFAFHHFPQVVWFTKTHQHRTEHLVAGRVIIRLYCRRHERILKMCSVGHVWLSYAMSYIPPGMFFLPILCRPPAWSILPYSWKWRIIFQVPQKIQ